MAGLYIHIPFCKSRCIYCGFYSTTQSSLVSSYVSALCREAELRQNYVKEPIETIYLGGGTPSQIPYNELKKLFVCIYKIFNVDTNAEITIECNPDDVTPDFVENLKTLPINRVSMGAQTFSDCRLRFLHRRHTAAEVDSAVKVLREFGINNISIDLMFGFPKESLTDWNCDLEHALRLNVEHISAYSLMYEEGTTLFKMLENGFIKEVDENVSLAMYDLLINCLTNVGYEHYEISNFARPGFRSRHNSNYWNQTPYIGLGAAAHSYNLISRQWNVSDVCQYIQGICDGSLPFERENLDVRTRYNDLITTALRTSDGLNLDGILNDFGKDYYSYCIDQSQCYLTQELVKITKENHLCLTRKGLFISDMVMSNLMRV